MKQHLRAAVILALVVNAMGASGASAASLPIWKTSTTTTEELNLLDGDTYVPQGTSSNPMDASFQISNIRKVGSGVAMTYCMDINVSLSGSPIDLASNFLSSGSTGTQSLVFMTPSIRVNLLNNGQGGVRPSLDLSKLQKGNLTEVWKNQCLLDYSKAGENWKVPPYSPKMNIQAVLQIDAKYKVENGFVTASMTAGAGASSDDGGFTGTILAFLAPNPLLASSSGSKAPTDHTAGKTCPYVGERVPSSSGPLVCQIVSGRRLWQADGSSSGSSVSSTQNSQSSAASSCADDGAGSNIDFASAHLQNSLQGQSIFVANTSPCFVTVLLTGSLTCTYGNYNQNSVPASANLSLKPGQNVRLTPGSSFPGAAAACHSMAGNRTWSLSLNNGFNDQIQSVRGK